MFDETTTDRQQQQAPTQTAAAEQSQQQVGVCWRHKNFMLLLINKKSYSGPVLLQGN